MMARPFTPFLTTLLIRTVCWWEFYFYYHVIMGWLAGWLVGWGLGIPFDLGN